METILEAIHAYLDGVESYKDVAQKYQVNITQLKEWIARYNENGYQAFHKS
ncbi:helix-turn-helix domain-containing protein [Croceifilum oryzae]|uniref:helix-turn-helix domain-containing protein n=1 Tax=Croceifilum oryzae TaxID=1553429 RepID=UPI003521C77F